MQTEAGQEVWHVVQMGASLIRTAGLGAPVGLDIPGLLKICESLGYDQRAAAVMLPAASAGFMSAMQKERENNGAQ